MRMINFVRFRDFYRNDGDILMSMSEISQLSNSFSTGGGGCNFEQRIQAMFILSLLIEGFCPVMNERAKRISFQAKRLGYATDDFVVFTDRNQAEGKMLCQVKRSIKATRNDKIFQEVISAAWSDFNNINFDKNHDKIALATAQIAYTSQQALRFLHAQSMASIDEQEFIKRINLLNFASKTDRAMLDTIKSCITKVNEISPTDLEVWQFCKSFVLLLFDLDCVESINKALTVSLIKFNSSEKPQSVWSRLVEYAGDCNQNAADVNCNSLDESLLELFSDKKVKVFFAEPIIEPDSFLPIVALVGAWNAKNVYDRQVIETIVRMPYSEFENQAKRMFRKENKYFEFIDDKWKVLGKECLLDQCKDLISNDNLEGLIEGAKIVFNIKNDFIPNRSSYYMITEEHNNSKRFRKNLIISLCWVKSNLDNLPYCDNDKWETALNLFVKELLGDGEWKTLVSLQDCMQEVAELAPEFFLSAVERVILRNKEAIMNLFLENEENMFGEPNCISRLIRAIETLAWAPNYLISSVGVLALLGGVTCKKSKNLCSVDSIASILLPWYPQTMAAIDRRNDALRCLREDNSEICWDVLMKLLPKGTPSTTDHSKPRFLPLYIPEERVVTYQELWKQYEFCFKMVLEISSNEVEKLIKLIDKIEYMNEDILIEYLNCIERNIELVDDNMKAIVWLKLCEHIALINPKEDTVLYDQMKRVKSLINKVEPSDIYFKYQELYIRKRHCFINGENAISWDQLEDRKRLAVKEIFDTYGLKETEKFGYSVKNICDVAIKLGQIITNNNFSDIIDEYYIGNLVREFFVSCLNSFVDTQGINALLETVLVQKDLAFICKVLSCIPLSIELLEIVQQLQVEEVKYWEGATIPYGCSKEEEGLLNLALEKLISVKRYITAINLLGRSEFKDIVGIDRIYNLLMLVGKEESIGNEKIDDYAIEGIIEWFQQQEAISLKLRSDVDFVYLPMLNVYSGLESNALNLRLSTEADYFCSLIELFYKKDRDKNLKYKENKELGKRLFNILYPFKIVPGANKEGKLDKAEFKRWFDFVKKWSIEHDRYAVTMHTVGTGLSYAKLDENKFPPEVIVKELNNVENRELRRGYYLGIVNQRGVHYVDPEGKPELEMASDYENRACTAERKGYSKYAGVLREIAEHYTKEARHNRIVAQRELEE